MINILPAITETLVLPYAGEDVERRIREGIENGKFNGICAGGKFRLSIRQLRPPQFQPFISGSIEPTSRGCLVMLKHQLQPATRLLLVFACMIILITGIGATLTGFHWVYAVTAVLVVIGIRGVALANLSIHKEPLRGNLLEKLQ